MREGLSVFDPADERPFRSWAIWIAVTPAVATFLLRLFVPQRPDYAGHFLAGFGASLLLIWLLSRIFSGRPWSILVGTWVSIALGAGAEATLFALGGFDPADFCSQSIGAVIAGLALFDLMAGDPLFDSADDFSPLARNAHGRLVIVSSVIAVIVGGCLAFS